MPGVSEQNIYRMQRKRHRYGADFYAQFGGEAQPEDFETLLGTTTYIGLFNFGAVYANGDYDNNYLDMEEHYNDEVQIVILGQQGEVISHLYYTAGW